MTDGSWGTYASVPLYLVGADSQSSLGGPTLGAHSSSCIAINNILPLILTPLLDLHLNQCQLLGRNQTQTGAQSRKELTLLPSLLLQTELLGPRAVCKPLDLKNLFLMAVVFENVYAFLL